MNIFTQDIDESGSGNWMTIETPDEGNWMSEGNNGIHTFDDDHAGKVESEHYVNPTIYRFLRRF